MHNTTTTFELLSLKTSISNVLDLCSISTCACVQLPTIMTIPSYLTTMMVRRGTIMQQCH